MSVSKLNASGEFILGKMVLSEETANDVRRCLIRYKRPELKQFCEFIMWVAYRILNGLKAIGFLLSRPVWDKFGWSDWGETVQLINLEAGRKIDSPDGEMYAQVSMGLATERWAAKMLQDCFECFQEDQPLSDQIRANQSQDIVERLVGDGYLRADPFSLTAI